MADYRTALALISTCIVVCLSGLGDCRIPFQREEVVARVGEKEPSVHLLLQRPLLRENDGISNEIARESQPLLSLPVERPLLSLLVDRSLLRENDGIFQGERSGRSRFWRPDGCHHGKINRTGQRKDEHMPFRIEFPGVRAESTEFVHVFPNGGEGRQHRDEQAQEEKENDHVHFPEMWSEALSHAVPLQAESTKIHSRVDHIAFPDREWTLRINEHAKEENAEREKANNNHMANQYRWAEALSDADAVPVQAEPTEFHSRVEQFLPLLWELLTKVFQVEKGGIQDIDMHMEKKKKERINSAGDHM